MSSINSLGNQSSLYSTLFSKLDTKRQGYLELSDLESAYSAINGNGGTTASSSASDVFSALDGNSDGKVTESEFTSTLNGLESQFQQMRMQGMGGHGPHGMGGQMPPPQNDTGFTKEELQNQLAESSDDDSQRTSFISNVVNNFEAADSNGDGKVTFQEAASYNSQNSGSGAESGGTSSTSDSSSATSQLLASLMAGMNGMGGMPPPPPQNDGGFSKDELQSQLSAVSSTDSQRASLLNNIVSNFSSADSDGDGKVTRQEAMAFEQSSQSGSSSSSTTANSESAVLQKIMQLVQAYSGQQGRAASLISATA